MTLIFVIPRWWRLPRTWNCWKLKLLSCVANCRYAKQHWRLHDMRARQGKEVKKGGEDRKIFQKSLLPFFAFFSFGWKKMTVCSFLKPSVSATFGLLILAQQRLHLGFPIPGAAGNGDFVAKQIGTPAAWAADEGVAKSGGFLDDGFLKWHKDLVIICFGGDEVTQWILKWHKNRSVICFGDHIFLLFVFLKILKIFKDLRREVVEPMVPRCVKFQVPGILNWFVPRFAQWYFPMWIVFPYWCILLLLMVEILKKPTWDVNINIHQKLNGTESQRTPGPSKLRDRAISQV